MCSEQNGNVFVESAIANYQRYFNRNGHGWIFERTNYKKNYVSETY